MYDLTLVIYDTDSRATEEEKSIAKDVKNGLRKLSFLGREFEIVEVIYHKHSSSGIFSNLHSKLVINAVRICYLGK